MSKQPPKPVAKGPAKGPVTKAAPKAAPPKAAPPKAASPKAATTRAAPPKAAPPKTAPPKAAPEAAAASAVIVPPPQRLEQKYEKELKSVLTKLFNNDQSEELTFTWFLQRHDVHRRERNLIDDRYQVEGMEYREETTEEDIKRAAECLTALEAEPDQRKIVAELCEWLRYQGMPPRALHLYPEELKTVCGPVTAKKKVAELATIVNAFFKPPEHKKAVA